MTAVYIAVTVIAAAVNGCAAYLNFTGHDLVKRAADAVKVPHSWMLPLGTLLAAGACGLIVGFAVPAIGTLAAAGLVLYFICAIGAHLRVGDSGIGNPAFFLVLAIGALVVGLVHQGPT